MRYFSDLVALAGRLGGYQLARLLTRRQPRILMYHRFSVHPKHGHVSQSRFRAQLAYIRRFYHPITLNQLAAGVFEGAPLPTNALVITVDDGYRDFYEVAFPLLREAGIPATLFATTGFINGDLWLWPDQVTWLLKAAPDQPMICDLGALQVASIDARDDFGRQWGLLIRYLLSIPDTDKHQAIAQLAADWSLALPAQAPDAYAACSWVQLAEMQAAGMEIGGHTVTHPSLGQVGEAQAVAEITDCLNALNDALGTRPRPFCYPNGEPGDFSPALEGLVAQAGFTCAVAAFADAAGMRHRFALRRHSGSEDWFQFYKSVSGVECLGHRLRKSIRGHVV